MYPVRSPSCPARLNRCTRGSAFAISVTMVAVPSGELSSTTSTSRFVACDNTNSTIDRIFSFSLYVGIITSARSSCATLFRLLHKPRICQHQVYPLLKYRRPPLLLHLLEHFPHTLQTHGIPRIDAHWQLPGSSVRERSLLHPVFHYEKLRLLQPTIEPVELGRNVSGQRHVIVHSFVTRTKRQHAAAVAPGQPVDLFRHNHEVIFCRVRIHIRHRRLGVRRGMLGPHVDPGVKMIPCTGSRLHAKGRQHNDGDRRRRRLL